MSRIALVEVFRSVQGEGYNSGRAAIFVRFTGCNLACRFAEGVVCDTPYQHANLRAEGVDDLFTTHIYPLLSEAELARLDCEGPCEDEIMLVLTGGEPTLQPHFDDIVHRAWQEGFYVAVETNGTRYRKGLDECTWISCSPKEAIAQGSPQSWHNPHPGSPLLDQEVVALLELNADSPSGEYRYVITAGDPMPPFHKAFRHCVSPAINSDGSGTEWQDGFPGFAPGALERCLEIVQEDPRWRISLQTHKIIKQR